MVLQYFFKVVQMYYYKEDERFKKEIWIDVICNDV